MYLHLGQDTVIKTSEIIGIFDMDNTTVAKATRRFLTLAQKQNRVVTVSEELPKTFVVCGGRQKSTVYISQISVDTLRKRTGFIRSISNV